MRLLLDTHALIWALSAVRKLPRPVAESIVDPANEVFASAASAWEIAIKAALGKIEAEPKSIAAAARATGFVELPVTFAHGVRVRELPHHHRDPFDRILVAQAIEEGLSIVTGDDIFDRYSVPRAWK